MNHFIVYDFETDGVNPNICSPVQIAAIAIHPYNLEIIESSTFHSFMKPERDIVITDEETGESKTKTITIDNPEYFNKEINDTIDWHAKIRKCSRDEIISLWKAAPPTELVWKNFSSYINKYNPKKTQFEAPYAAGMNIRNFDSIITERLNTKYKIGKMFHHEYTDIRDWAFHALVWDTELRSRSMDNLRKYFGMSSENAHDALQDVKDSAKIICRYLQFFKNTFNKTKYKGCMS